MRYKGITLFPYTLSVYGKGSFENGNSTQPHASEMEFSKGISKTDNAMVTQEAFSVLLPLDPIF